VHLYECYADVYVMPILFNRLLCCQSKNETEKAKLEGELKKLQGVHTDNKAKVANQEKLTKLDDRYKHVVSFLIICRSSSSPSIGSLVVVLPKCLMLLVGCVG
jgi:hypothetical protein